MALQKPPVYVALSGGVDSAVVARLLQQEYDSVIGVSHRHWPESRCCSTECLDRCADQCRFMGIPYYPVDCMVEFAGQIVDDFVQTYEAGLTPNPCVLCNQNIRFDLMLRKLFEMHPELPSSDYKIATGHYARVEIRDGYPYLMRGIDSEKDQSYMLYRLSAEQLRHCVFPLGHYVKKDVRRMAEEWQLKSAKQGDSQDVCFVSNTYHQFLDQYTGRLQAPGVFVDLSGRMLGRHKGVAYYTRGQRKGIGLGGGPWYVLYANPKTAEITLGSKEDLALKTFYLHRSRWIYPDLPAVFETMVQLRYHSATHKALVEHVGDDCYRVTLEEPSCDVSPGQSAVCYNGDDVMGGGMIHYDAQ